MFYGNSYGYGIIYVNTWEYVGRCVCQIKASDQIRENVLPWEYRRAQVLAVRVQIGDHEERRHSDSQVDNQLIIFSAVLVAEAKIKDRPCNKSKPHKIRNHKKLTERNHIIKRSMNQMISFRNVRFQILKTFQIENTINHYRKKMLIFFYCLHSFPPLF